MIKSKFFKNLYQFLSIVAACVPVMLSLLWGYLESVQMEQPNDGWILLWVIAGLLVTCFVSGYFWIFQTVEMDGTGIRVRLFRKVIREITWDRVTAIHATSVMKNPAYTLVVYHEKDLNLDRRKSIRAALIHYCPEKKID